MSVTYDYSPPVGGATLMQVVYRNGAETKVLEIEAVFTDGAYDADATELAVAAEVNNVFNIPAGDPA